MEGVRTLVKKDRKIKERIPLEQDYVITDAMPSHPGSNGTRRIER